MINAFRRWLANLVSPAPTRRRLKFTTNFPRHLGGKFTIDIRAGRRAAKWSVEWVRPGSIVWGTLAKGVAPTEYLARLDAEDAIKDLCKKT